MKSKRRHAKILDPSLGFEEFFIQAMMSYEKLISKLMKIIIFIWDEKPEVNFECCLDVVLCL